MTAKMLFSFQDQLAERIKSTIPAGERSKLVSQFFENEVEKREQELYKAACEFSQDKELSELSQSLEEEFFKDGLDNVEL